MKIFVGFLECVKPWKNAFEINWQTKICLETKLAGSGEPEIVTFNRRSGIIKHYFLWTSGIIATSQRIWPCCLSWFAYYEKKKVLGPFSYFKANSNCECLGLPHSLWSILLSWFCSKDFNKIHIMIFYLTLVSYGYSISKYLMLMNFMIWCQRKFLICKDFLVSFEPKLNVRFYLPVASGQI